MPLAEYDENSGFYWLDSMHAYMFDGTEEERAQYERELLQSIQLEREIDQLAEDGKLNAYLRKYGLVTYRCKRGCLLGAVFNRAGEKYFYSWGRRTENLIETEGGLNVEYEVINQLRVNRFDIDSDRLMAVYRVGECRHLNATLFRSEVLEHIDALKRENKKTVYLSRGLKNCDKV